MKLSKITIFLLSAAVMFCLIAGCGAQSELVGTWEAKSEASILGVSIEVPVVGEGVILFSFAEDGTGAMTTEFGSAVPSTSLAYTYAVEENQLTLTYESGGTEVFTFTLEKDVLKLDGRVVLELNRAS